MMKALHMIAYILLFVGGLNWGLIGLFNFNLVTVVFGAGSMLGQIVYILVGVATVYVIVTHRGDCKVCGMTGKKK